jgi:ribosome biogenesis GTPase A
MTEIVAELRSLPFVEELHSLKASNEKMFGEIKRIGDAVATIDGIASSVAEVKKNIEDKVDSLGKSISQGVVVAVDDLKREIKSLGQDISEDQRKKFEEEQYATPLSAYLSAIAESRKLIKQGAMPDIDRASALILDDFRNGRLGRLSIERP